MEQARAFERLSREFNLTQEQIALRTGKDRASIANFIRLLKLPEAVQEALETGLLTFGHGKVLAGLVGFPQQLEHAAQEAIAKQLSVRQTEEVVTSLLNPEARGAKSAKTAPVQDPNVREAQRSLETALGVKVEIHDHKGKGKIILHYGSLEDFDRVVEALAVK
jgi:ParB family chromosome partitioning protein